MNETPSTVTENLAVNSGEQPSERKTRTIILIAAALLLIGGIASVVFKGNREELPATPTAAEQVTSPALPAPPASAARSGKDFGL